MKKLGIFLIIVGAVVCYFSWGKLRLALKETEPHEVTRQRLDFNWNNRFNDPITVDTARNCRLAVQIRVKTLSVKEVELDGAVEYQPLYRYEVRYKVKDLDGNVLHEEKVKMDGVFTHPLQEKPDDPEGDIVTPGRAVVTDIHRFAIFKVDPPGEIKIEIEVDPDTYHKSESEWLRLIVYDNVAQPGETLLGSAPMVLAGPVIAAIGLLMFIVGLLAGGKKDEDAEE